MSQRSRARQYEPEAICSAIVASRGIVKSAAYRLRCHPDTIYTAVKTFPEVAETLRLTRDETLDIAESHLFAAIERGEQWACEFFLKNTREGAARGYSARIDVQPVNIVVNVNRVVSREPEPEPKPFNRTPAYREMIRDLHY